MLNNFREEIDHILKDNEFRPFYDEILEAFRFNKSDDEFARDLLFSIIEKKKNYSLGKILIAIRKKITDFQQILVFGGGPDSENFLNLLFEDKQPNLEILSNSLIVAVDGALNLLREFGIIPDLVFSDLDGFLPIDIQGDIYRETYFIFHAHGDNINKIRLFENFLLKHKDLIGTTQSDSKLPIINHGGFTDGDRAIYFLKNYCEDPAKLFLVGYDFGDVKGRFSKPHLVENTHSDEFKRKKLGIGKKIMRRLFESSSFEIIFLELKFPILIELPESKKSNIRKISDINDLKRSLMI